MAHREENRPDPDALLAELNLADRPARGRLKIFLGAAPGVGKTFEMLAQAQRRRAAGNEVLGGYIETHRRAETAAQAAGLETLPRRQVAYRGQTLEEFDLDAALARQPRLILVDELAHTNAHGSRHAKRWEDVQDLLDAGIDVWTTLNVQHLESLNDDVAQITGVRPTETIPDRVLEMADEIELVDLPPAELRERLKQGKIYRSDNAARALDSFFREGNLAALREIALRRAAAHVDTEVRGWMRRTGVTAPWPTGERILALIGADPAAEAVVRQAKRLADAFGAPWAALHVEVPGRGAGSLLAARAPLSLAASLGAETEVAVLGERDLLQVIRDSALARNATHLVLGRPTASGWRRLLRRRLRDRLLRGGGSAMTLHMVPAPERPRSRATAPPARRATPWLPYAGGVAVVAAVTAVGHLLRREVPTEAADVVYIAGVIAVAAVGGTGPALLAAGLSVLAWDFFFIDPLYTVTIERPRDILTGLIFAVVAVLTGTLAGRVRREERAAAARIDGLRRIGEFSRRLGEPTTEADLLPEIAKQAAGLAGQAVVMTSGGDEIAVRAQVPVAEGDPLDEGAWAAARWCWTRGEQAGRGTPTLPSAEWRFLPLQTLRGRLGIVGVKPRDEIDQPRLQALESLVDQAALALERVRLALEAARTAAIGETQKLRTALLASLGHDLRTPLASIGGAAETLRSMSNGLAPETRADLLASIEEDVARMTRYLASITELTRLESGEVRPALGPVPLLDIVETAIARLPGAPIVATRIDPGLRALADPALLEQALFNVLDNAIKYSPPGSLVRVGATRQGATIELAVADEGVGIPADQLARIFDSFFRGDRAAPGTGLGLAIARGLVEAMGGRITALSPRPDAPREGLPGTVIALHLQALP